MQYSGLQGAAWRPQLDTFLAEICPGPISWRALGKGIGGSRWRLEQDGWSAFLKCGDADMLAAEADGLAALAGCGELRVPQVLHQGEAQGEGFVLMEWLALAPPSGPAAARLGEALARQHLKPAAHFGWHRSNFIGATPQFNRESDDWIGFFREQRLGFQLRMAAENGHRGELQRRGALLMEKLPNFFHGYQPHPALLHGDLWGGNWGVTMDGGPVVFDPAVHFGDRECDIAMTELFGGFPAEFHAAYRQHAPLDAGYGVRRRIYRLYHVLNHVNLFGDAYLAQALDLLDRSMSEIH